MRRENKNIEDNEEASLFSEISEFSSEFEEDFEEEDISIQSTDDFEEEGLSDELTDDFEEEGLSDELTEQENFKEESTDDFEEEGLSDELTEQEDLEEEIEEKTNIQKLIKWSSTNIKNISNYEEEVNLLSNAEMITIIKTTKTNLTTNEIIPKQKLTFIEEIKEINIDIDSFILKMHKYYLICISLGLIQKKIVLENQVISLNTYVKNEIKELKDFKSFLTSYSKKETELTELKTIEELFEKVLREIGATKR